MSLGLTIIVYAATGTMCKLRVDTLTSIEDVKHLLLQPTGIPLGEQRLLFGLTELQDAHTLQDYDIVAESALQLVWVRPRLTVE